MGKKEDSMLEAVNISYHAGKKRLLHPVSLSFKPGLFHVIMGPNGAGKSTLLKLLAGSQPPATGKVLLDGRELDRYSQKELATKRAVLSQHYHISFPITVRDIVLMGRYPYYGQQPRPEDISVCKEAMTRMEVADMADRDYATLSGGEAQKVQMSRVLAQIGNETTAKLLFLDEPVSNLDIRYQYELMRVAKELCGRNHTVIAILHDINLALSFADRIYFMKEGKMMHESSEPLKVTKEIIDDVFGVSSSIFYTDDKPVVVVRGN
jgi:iron complex transport system ATP-binding protein